jgi:hypothetical protein
MSASGWYSHLRLIANVCLIVCTLPNTRRQPTGRKFA